MTWDASSPAGSDFIRLGDDEIRELKTDLATALTEEGVFPGADASDPVFRWKPRRGNTASRPAPDASNPGTLYLNTDTQSVQRDNGSSWDDVTVPPQSDVRAGISSAQSVSLVSGDVTVQYNSEARDALGEYDPSTYTFTAAAAGKRLVVAAVKIGGSETDLTYGLKIKVNGSEVAFREVRNATFAGPTRILSIELSDVVSLAAGDTVQVAYVPANLNTTSLNDPVSSSYFCVKGVF